MFIQTESTPNPNALKFFPGCEVSSKPIHFSDIDESNGVKLVQNLFSLEGVEAVFYGADFITITKAENENWESLKTLVIAKMIDHLGSGLTPLEGFMANANSEIDTSMYSDLEKEIVEIIETRVRPAVAMDGGDITYKGFEQGIVLLELKGSCSGCPSSMITLKNGIESMLQHYVPEVQGVEAFEGE